MYDSCHFLFSKISDNFCKICFTIFVQGRTVFTYQRFIAKTEHANYKSRRDALGVLEWFLVFFGPASVPVSLFARIHQFLWLKISSHDDNFFTLSTTERCELFSGTKARSFSLPDEEETEDGHMKSVPSKHRFSNLFPIRKKQHPPQRSLFERRRVTDVTMATRQRGSVDN